MNAHPPQTVPQNIEAEQSLIGAIFMNNEAYYRVSDFLVADHFFEAIHKDVYRIVSQLIDAGKKADPVTVKSFVDAETKIGDEITVAQYLARLAASATTVLNARDYGETIFTAWQRRRIIGVCEDVSGEAYYADPDNLPASTIEKAITEFSGIDTGKKQSSTAIASIAEDYINQTSNAYQTQEISGIGLPLKELETLNHGPLEAGNLYGLLGGTKEGKSSLTAQIMRHAISQGHPVLCLSYDQTGVQWLRQFIAQSLGIDANEQRRGKITPKEFEQASDYARSISGQPFKVIKCGREGADQLVAYAKRFMQQNRTNPKPVLVVTDHVGKITPYDKRADAGKQAGEINQAIKAFAGEHECAWLNLIQRNSDGARRANPRPGKKDIYGGEGAVADYDCIFYVYREEKWLRDQLRSVDPTNTKEIDRLTVRVESIEVKDKAELGLIAHRFAPEHLIRSVRFIAKYTRYESVEDQPSMGW